MLLRIFFDLSRIKGELRSFQSFETCRLKMQVVDHIFEKDGRIKQSLQTIFSKQMQAVAPCIKRVARI